MEFVYSFVPVRPDNEERDLPFLLEKKAPFVIRTGSGNFRVMLRKVIREKDWITFIGTAGPNDVHGVYYDKRNEGVVIFLREDAIVKV